MNSCLEKIIMEITAQRLDTNINDHVYTTPHAEDIRIAKADEHK